MWLRSDVDWWQGRIQISPSQKAHFQLDSNHVHLKILPAFVRKTPDVFPVSMKPIHLNQWKSELRCRACACPHGQHWKVKSRGQSSGKMLMSAMSYLQSIYFREHRSAALPVELWSHWEWCAHLIQFKCARYSCDDLTLSVTIYIVSILFQNHPQRHHEEKISWFSYTANVNRKTVDSTGIWTSHLREHRYAALYQLSCRVTDNGVLI